jgi:hypothetical protein
MHQPAGVANAAKSNRSSVAAIALRSSGGVVPSERYRCSASARNAASTDDSSGKSDGSRVTQSTFRGGRYLARSSSRSTVLVNSAT